MPVSADRQNVRHSSAVSNVKKEVSLSDLLLRDIFFISDNNIQHLCHNSLAEHIMY